MTVLSEYQYPGTDVLRIHKEKYSNNKKYFIFYKKWFITWIYGMWIVWNKKPVNNNIYIYIYIYSDILKQNKHEGCWTKTMYRHTKNMNNNDFLNEIHHSDC